MRWLFLVVLVVLFEALTYGAGRGVQWFMGAWLNAKSLRHVMWAMFAISHVFLLLAMSRVLSVGLKVAMMWLTVLWFMVMVTLAVGLISVVLNKIAPHLTAHELYQVWGVRAMLAGGVSGLLALGMYNAYTPVVRHLTMTANHPMSEPVRVAMVSDLHLGWLVGNREIDNLTEIVKREKVQLLLMPGDIMDDNVEEYTAKQMQPHLQNLVQSVPMGVYASLGNHDMYGDETNIRKALQQAGVRMLADEKALVADKLWLVGRFDNHARNRKATAELLPQVIDKPIILLDHEPNEIEKNVQSPIDLQVSGHTHNGQIFPANFIVQRLNRVGYGHERIHNTDVVVSSGYGFWGVPFRLASQSEVWVIDIVGKK